MADSDEKFPFITKSQFLQYTSAPSVNDKQSTNRLMLYIQQNGNSRSLTQGEMNWFMCSRYSQGVVTELIPFNPNETKPHELGFTPFLI